MNTLSVVADICSILGFVMSGLAVGFVIHINTTTVKIRDITNKSVNQTAIGNQNKQVGGSSV